MTVLCRVMQVSSSAYYEWLKAPQDSDKDQQDQKLAENARQIFIDNKQCFGSRRLADRLQKQGHAVGRFKTRRIMRDLKLKVRYPRRVKVTTDSNHNEALTQPVRSAIPGCQAQSSMDDRYYLRVDPARLALCRGGHRSVFPASRRLGD
ncbi:transposase [Candidatus Methylospira mobilis]|uniref:Transposase n=1 Tax=Candidatus Methylospira mobilis TaxID=1808979 RepID=A0A5Q0BJ62_9GAMM|nr:transposase [Candidatus Methylospira mobilis]